MLIALRWERGEDMKKEIEKYFKKVNPLEFKDEKIEKVNKLGNGESHLNFLIETNKNKYLMRFDITNKSASVFRQEYEILKRLEHLNIAPKPLFLDTSKKFFKDKFAIFSYIDGESLNKLKNSMYSPYYGKLAQKLSNLHKLNINFLNKAHSFDKHLVRIEKTIKQLRRDLKEFNNTEKIEGLFDIYHETLKNKLKQYKPVLTFCHGDVCLPNTLFNKNDFFLIDWELSGRLDPALELSYHFCEFAYTEKQKEMFLKEYLKIRQDKTLKKRMEFTDFFVAFSNYFDIIHTCFNIAKKRGHKDYLESANFEEYWKWGNYYLTLVCKLNMFDKGFEKELKRELNEIYEKMSEI